MTSPGSNVKTSEQKANKLGHVEHQVMGAGILKHRPLTESRTPSFCGSATSSRVARNGPMTEKVSNPHAPGILAIPSW
jgi:hypothetical protein